jgi:uncharacterized protein YjbJ (UPF0337 family)
MNLKGIWTIAKGKLKQKYPRLTDNDLAYIDGEEEEMLAQIERRTGVAHDELKQYLLTECGSFAAT